MLQSMTPVTFAVSSSSMIHSVSLSMAPQKRRCKDYRLDIYNKPLPRSPFLSTQSLLLVDLAARDWLLDDH